MKRMAVFVYGLASYALFFGTFLYIIGFLGNQIVPKSVDSGTEGSMGVAIAVNLLLIVVFGIQHMVMARPGFKAWWTKFVPTPTERSTYVVLSSVGHSTGERELAGRLGGRDLRRIRCPVLDGRRRTVVGGHGRRRGASARDEEGGQRKFYGPQAVSIQGDLLYQSEPR